MNNMMFVGCKHNINCTHLKRQKRCLLKLYENDELETWNEWTREVHTNPRILNDKLSRDEKMRKILKYLIRSFKHFKNGVTTWRYACSSLGLYCMCQPVDLCNVKADTYLKANDELVELLKVYKVELEEILENESNATDVETEFIERDDEEEYKTLAKPYVKPTPIQQHEHWINRLTDTTREHQLFIERQNKFNKFLVEVKDRILTMQNKMKTLESTLKVTQLQMSSLSQQLNQEWEYAEEQRQLHLTRVLMMFVFLIFGLLLREYPEVVNGFFDYFLTIDYAGYVESGKSQFVNFYGVANATVTELYDGVKEALFNARPYTLELVEE